MSPTSYRTAPPRVGWERVFTAAGGCLSTSSTHGGETVLAAAVATKRHYLLLLLVSDLLLLSDFAFDVTEMVVACVPLGFKLART